MTAKITIKGQIPSKKNTIKRGRYGNFYNSKQKEIDNIILQFKNHKIKKFKGEIEIDYKIYCKQARQDKSNIEATIDDCLQASEIIENDRKIIKTSSEIYYHSKEDEAIIIIKEYGY